MAIFPTDPRLEGAPNIWGPGFFDNDIGVVTRDWYLSLLVEGRSNDDATRLVMEVRKRDAYDIDFRLFFWTSLAETQRLIGHLEQVVVDSLLHYLEMGDGPTMRGHKEFYPKRDELLDDLRRRVCWNATVFPVAREDIVSFCRRTWGDVAADRLE